MTHLSNFSIKSLPLLALVATLAMTSGCQTMHAKPMSPTTAPMTNNSANGQVNHSTTDQTPSKQPVNAVTPTKLDSFMINGKIGVTTAATETREAQAGSAFYAWGQQNERFAIELMGALGIGKTNIDYDGQTATLVSEKAGTLTANSPDELLQKATGWQVPISQLPYWISGRSAPSDTGQQLDADGRLIAAINGNWTGEFGYANGQSLPNKITARHQSGHKVVMTINHQTVQ